MSFFCQDTEVSSHRPVKPKPPGSAGPRWMSYQLVFFGVKKGHKNREAENTHFYGKSEISKNNPALLSAKKCKAIVMVLVLLGGGKIGIPQKICHKEYCIL